MQTRSEGSKSLQASTCTERCAAPDSCRWDEGGVVEVSEASKTTGTISWYHHLGYLVKMSDFSLVCNVWLHTYLISLSSLNLKMISSSFNVVYMQVCHTQLKIWVRTVQVKSCPQKETEVENAPFWHAGVCGCIMNTVSTGEQWVYTATTSVDCNNQNSQPTPLSHHPPANACEPPPLSHLLWATTPSQCLSATSSEPPPPSQCLWATTPQPMLVSHLLWATSSGQRL